MISPLNWVKFTLDLLSVYEVLSTNYPGLFGRAYPFEKRQALLTHLIQRNSMLPVFLCLFDQAQSETELEDLFAQKLPLWKRFWRHYRDVKT